MRVKGVLHQRLQARLQAAWKAGELKQESLSLPMQKSQRSVSAYLRGDADAGALDLDEADAALMHIGSSLAEFLADTPPRDLSREEALARSLASKPKLRDMVEALTDVRPPRLSEALELVRGAVIWAIGTREARKRGWLTTPGEEAPQTPARTLKRPKRWTQK